MVVLTTSEMHEGNTFLTLAAQDVYVSACAYTNVCACKVETPDGRCNKGCCKRQQGGPAGLQRSPQLNKY